MKKIRIDQHIFEQGFAPSRERAKAIVMSGNVFVNSARVDKPGTMVDPEKPLEVKGGKLPYVSRGGLKLEKALSEFDFSPTGLTCIDCGASTGGFTDVLLQNGAKRVYAVDVGYGQLAWELRCDERVVNLERTNVRYISCEQIPEALDLAVMDLAFISIKLVIPAVSALLKENGNMICLIKPQFEAGKDKIGKKGVVRDIETHIDVVREISNFAQSAGLSVMALSFSPIRGPEGNIEYLIHLKKGNHDAPSPDPEAIAKAAHAGF